MDHHATTYLLQVEGMECGQHIVQSQQPVSEKILNTAIHPKCSTPWEREGFSKTDSTQYCNSKKHWNQEEAQFLTTPPMHQIHQTEALKTILEIQPWTWKQTEDK